MARLTINKEFQKLIFPLTDDEYSLLEKSILADGCRDALIVWDNTVIDGHHRLKICTEHNIPYKQKEKKFQDEAEAKLFILTNQLARRNLTLEQRTYIKGLQYKITKRMVGEKYKDDLQKVEHSKVEVDMARRAEHYANSIDSIEDRQLEQAILKRKVKSTREDVKKLSQLPKADRKKVKKKLKDRPNLKVAMSEVRQEKKAEAVKNKQLPTGIFDVIYADPPWSYDSTIQANANVKDHYPTMTFEGIKNIKLPTDDDCILFLWVTGPKIYDGLELLTHWGFDYKGMFVWDKEIMGMGTWMRWQHEILLLGIKGDVSPPTTKNRFSTMINYKRMKHSKKPDLVYTMIEKMFPDRRYLELFARKKHSEKWTVWGNQL